MKTKEQIETAQEIIKGLQDYVELAKVERKLKDKVNIENINNQLNVIVETITTEIEEL